MKAGGGQLPSLVTNASEPGYQSAHQEQAVLYPQCVRRMGKPPKPRIKVVHEGADTQINLGPSTRRVVENCTRVNRLSRAAQATLASAWC